METPERMKVLKDQIERYRRCRFPRELPAEVTDYINALEARVVELESQPLQQEIEANRDGYELVFPVFPDARPVISEEINKPVRFFCLIYRRDRFISSTRSRYKFSGVVVR